ncbi:sulfotransferase domain-containing protein [Desulfonema magnum]|uniref:Sulfotransferase domain-containing protein n=1 Tax=Desulfonema magnum TaxID=45655 RepID=A0A975BY06_9BACT|nr:sulfotransferase domain-containing protein [Desulfonema magnum]QTA93602.1 Sulfotransferase domain-containing protein [Desulfonema magnum]
MIQQKNNLFWHKFNALTRRCLAYGFSGVRPFYIVNEYPKSGGSWLSQMLGAALDVPFPRNRLPMLRPCILQEHYLRPGNLKNVVIIWRDGRDVTISHYYYSLFPNNRGNQIQVDRVSADLNFDDINNIKKNLPSFIEYIFETKKNPKFSWTDFVDKWRENKNAVHVRYEDLREDCEGELQRIVLELTGNILDADKAREITQEFSFQKQSGRRPGQEDKNNFMRKGIVGDWKNYFSSESKEMFAYYAGSSLISLGYETDNSWIEC